MVNKIVFHLIAENLALGFKFNMYIFDPKFYPKIAISVFWKNPESMPKTCNIFWNATYSSQTLALHILLKTPKSFRLQTSWWSRNTTWVIRSDQLSKKILNFLMICKNLWSVRTDFQGIRTFHFIFKVLAT